MSGFDSFPLFAALFYQRRFINYVQVVKTRRFLKIKSRFPLSLKADFIRKGMRNKRRRDVPNSRIIIAWFGKIDRLLPLIDSVFSISLRSCNGN